MYFCFFNKKKEKLLLFMGRFCFVFCFGVCVSVCVGWGGGGGLLLKAQEQ